MSRSPSQGFTLDADFLDVPRVRQQTGTLLRGWSSKMSPGTKRYSIFDLHQFAAFVFGEEAPPPLGERDDTRAASVMLWFLRTGSAPAAVSGFIEWLTVRGFSASTTIRKVKTLRLWARYLYERRAVPRSLDAFPIPSVASLRLAEPKTSTGIEHLPPATQVRVRELLAARDQAIEDLLGHSSVGRDRLIELDWKDVELGGWPMREEGDVHAPPARVRFPLRGGREFWRHLVPHATRALRCWRRAYVQFFGRVPPDQPVFVTMTGKRLSPEQLREVVDR